MFLEDEQSHGGTPSPSEVKNEEKGGGDGRGRKASVTSVESEMSACSIGRLGNTIANSEWDGEGSRCPHCTILCCKL